MNVHKLGAPLGVWKEGYSDRYYTSSSILPVSSGYHTEGVTWRKASFPPPSAHLSGGHGFEPRDRQKFFCMKFNCLLEWMISMLNLTFLSYFFPIQLVWWCTDPCFFLFNLCASCTLLYLHCYLRTSLSFFSIHTHKPCHGNFQLKHALWVPEIPTTSICKLLRQLCPHCSSIFRCAG